MLGSPRPPRRRRRDEVPTGTPSKKRKRSAIVPAPSPAPSPAPPPAGSSPAAEDDDLGVDGPDNSSDEDYHCELSHSDEDIDSEGSGASARAGKRPKRRHVSQIKVKYVGKMKIYTHNGNKVETERFQVQIGGKSSRTIDTFQGVIVDTAITCKDLTELTDIFEGKLVKRFRRRKDDKTFDENEPEAWKKELTNISASIIDMSEFTSDQIREDTMDRVESTTARKFAQGVLGIHTNKERNNSDRFNALSRVVSYAGVGTGDEMSTGDEMGTSTPYTPRRQAAFLTHTPRRQAAAEAPRPADCKQAVGGRDGKADERQRKAGLLA